VFQVVPEAGIKVSPLNSRRLEQLGFYMWDLSPWVLLGSWSMTPASLPSLVSSQGMTT